MEDDFNLLAKWKTALILRKMEDNLNLKVIVRQPKYFLLMEDNLSFLLVNAGLADPIDSPKLDTALPQLVKSICMNPRQFPALKGLLLDH
jgi:hypothetical protein